MAQKQKKAPAAGPDGIDRWTTNGVGLKLDPLAPAKKANTQPKKKKGK